MQTNRFSPFKPSKFIHVIPAILASVAMLLSAASASSTKVIYRFAGGNDGEYLDTDLVMDRAGNIYGTTVQGGDFGSGTVFQLSPSPSGWTHTVLYSFTGGRDGGEPYKGVTLDSHGNLFGTAVTGGAGSCEGGCGVVFKLTNSSGSWTQSVIHYFSGGNDGSGPGSGLTFDKHGHLYGMTPTGGAFGLGVVYQLKLQDGAWKLRVIHTFTGGADGSSGSAGRLMLDHAGNLYGVTTVGGANGKGVAFELTRTETGWKLLPLYAFKDQPDGALPYGGLIFDKAGNLYGTTYYAGANDVGTVYKLTHADDGSWTETVLYSFKGGTDGSSPISTLVSDAAGNLYGTTSDGGTSCACGVIFKLAPNANGTWTETVPFRFTGVPGAGFAYNGMVSDSSGNFYGATTRGGPNNDGTIYKFTP
jgi:uncharacterized repeat protein (TIGR03803 family)